MDASPLNALAQYLSTFDPRTKKRGKAYARDARALVSYTTNHVIEGYVDGSREYFVHFGYERHTGWEAECDCPIGYECKHAFALGATVLAENGHPLASAAPTKKAVRRAKNGLFAPAQKILDRPLNAKEERFLERVQKAWHLFQEEGVASDDVLTLLANQDVHYRTWKQIDRLGLYLNEPPQDPLELLGYACIYFKLNEVNVPPFAKKLLDLTDYQARVKRNLHLNEIRSWKATLEQSSKARLPKASPPAAPIQLAMVLGKSKCEIHARSEGPYHRVDSAQLQELRESTATNLSTQAIAFLGAAEHFLQHWRGASTAPTTQYARAFLHRLLQHPELRNHVLDTSHTPIRWSDKPLRWIASKSISGKEPQAQLRLCLPSGKPLPQNAIVLQLLNYDTYGNASPAEDDAPLYLSKDKVYPGPPPVEGKTTLALPWEVIESEQGVAFLRSQGSELPPEIAERVDTLQPQLRLRASTIETPSSWGRTRSLHVELEAVDAQNRPLRHFTPTGWSHTEEEPASHSTERIQLVDPSALLDLSSVLSKFSLKWDEPLTHWHRPLRDVTDLPDFGSWLQTLPPEINVELSPDLAGLDSAPVSLSYEVDIQETDTRDWFDVKLVQRVGDTQLTDEEMQLLLAAPGRFVQLPSGQWRRLDIETTPETTELMQELGMEKSDGTQRLHTLQLQNEAASSALTEQAKAQLHARLDTLRAQKLPTPPRPFGKILRPYQRDGFQFLCQLTQLSFGGILADDMGLGKTLQALAWLVWLKANRPKPKSAFRVLVVCPKSVMDNWLSEPGKFKTGLTSARHQSKPDAPQANALAAANLVVANYTQLRSSADAFLAETWDAIILDEAQYIKNPASQTARIACQLATPHRIVLTGTPIENRSLDLWSLLRFAMPGALGSQAQFKRLYNEKKDPQALPRLARRIQPFLLRRTKREVAQDLPDRIEEELHCQLEGAQAKLYQAELKKARQLLVEVKTKRQFDKSRFNILQSLLRLRQICCDPQLLGAKPSKTPSAKTQALLEHIQPLVEEGHKILVFSQFVSMLELLQPALDAIGIPSLMLTGKTQDRAALVERFQKPDTEKVFLLSLKAAGSGLNLTAASYVALFDPWWNPAVEAQAIDRTHRIGQKRQVIAYRLIAKDTIEEKIRALQKEKSQLASTLIDDPSLATALDLDTIRVLLAET
ncbi:DEAD/DEAH box helicase [Pelagicoccus sp. SDUM812002]|uniref:DEAD/DEAH box helicase n=1 Tax=Pelagicoccus sp. SDUM812002 TaxID=3041266 RepID=UPI00280E304F|nr:DEAD/DEAH box helicase [Pelagicoccus sp. SDUM812002]MDQ8186301.1 DEAD/DEAH box helicase [Pelagicoccus sp. SDUM812002]